MQLNNSGLRSYKNIQYGLRIVVLVLLTMSSQYGCGRTIPPDTCKNCDGGIDVQQFEDLIHHGMGDPDNVIGYGFAISQCGEVIGSGQGGFAQMPGPDNPHILFTSLTDIQVASVSKPITAIAVLQLMEKLGVGPDDPISDFLPASWTKGEGFDSDGISFDDLLSHQTGFDQVIADLGDELPSPNTWEGLQLIVRNGISADVAGSECPTTEDGVVMEGGEGLPVAGHYGVYCYKNLNYLLAQVLIWRMALDAGDLGPDDDTDDPLEMPEASASGYQKYVQDHVLAPAGVAGTCTATDIPDNRSLMYDITGFVPFEIFTAGIDAYDNDESDLLECGPYNWSLSAMDLAQVMGEFSCGELLSEDSRNLMRTRKMGFHPDSNSDRSWHGGYWKQNRSSVAQWLYPLHPDYPPNADASTPGCDPEGADLVCKTKGPSEGRIRTCVIEFTPFNVDVALVMNSNFRDDLEKGPCSVLRNAFDQLLQLQ